MRSQHEIHPDEIPSYDPIKSPSNAIKSPLNPIELIMIHPYPYIYYVYIYIYVYIYVYMYICIYMYIYVLYILYTQRCVDICNPQSEYTWFPTLHDSSRVPDWLKYLGNFDIKLVSSWCRFTSSLLSYKAKPKRGMPFGISHIPGLVNIQKTMENHHF